VLAKRKGVTARWGLKEAWSKTATVRQSSRRGLTNRNRIGGRRDRTS